MHGRSLIRSCSALLLLLALLAVFTVFSGKGKTEEPLCLFYLGQEQSVWDDGSGRKPADLIGLFSLPGDRQYGCVLPGDWDASRLRIFFPDTDELQIGGRFYRSGDRISLELEKPFSVSPLGGREIQVSVRKTGGLPVLFIQTDSGSSEAIHADRSAREPGRLLMTDAAGRVLYQEPLTAVRARGNSTFHNDKKPYQIKLAEKLPLTGDRPGKTWILLANALDRSEIRSTLGLDLARYCGAFAYTPDTQPVDLYLNNDYQGSYLLTEKVEIASGRVPVRDLEKLVKAMNPGLDFAALETLGESTYAPGAQKYRGIPAEPDDLTGGYLILLNKAKRFASEACGFVSERGGPFTSQEPKYLSQAQTQYLASLFQRIEDALFSEDGVDPVSGQHYSELLDLSTLVSRYLLAEVLDDYDGAYCYFYKDSDSVDPKLYVGPVWDLDNTLGLWKSRCDPEALHLSRDAKPAWSWLSQAAQHADFHAEAAERYARIFRPGIRILLGREKDPAGVLRSIDEYAEELSASARMDFFRWPEPPLSDAVAAHFNTASGDSFEEQVAYLKDYLTIRLDALDAFFGAQDN